MACRKEASVVATDARMPFWSMIAYIGDAGSLHDVVARLFFSGERGRDNLEGRIPELLRAARFEQVAEVGRRFSLFGPIVHHRGLREGASPAAA